MTESGICHRPSRLCEGCQFDRRFTFAQAFRRKHHPEPPVPCSHEHVHDERDYARCLDCGKDMLTSDIRAEANRLEFQKYRLEHDRIEP